MKQAYREVGTGVYEGIVVPAAAYDHPEGDDELPAGVKVLARCGHEHREVNRALECSRRLLRRTSRTRKDPS